MRDPEGLQQSVQFFKDDIGMWSDNIRQEAIASCVQHMPQPPLIVFLLHITPLLIQFALTRNLHFMGHIADDGLSQELRIDMRQ